MSLAPPQPAHGLTPPVLTNNLQYQRSLLQLRSKDKSLEKYIFLSSLKDTDEAMFYHVLIDHMLEVTPLIYTPTVGEACLEYSHIYRKPEGLWISIQDRGNIRSVLRNWPRKDTTRIAVMTDGSRILGLGDLGVNGMPISIGKLSLYVAGAGIKPETTLPICLDLGTNNQKNLDDPLYLGLKQKRIGDKEMEEFMDELMKEIAHVFPRMLLQFEDFSTEHAFHYLTRYKIGRVPVFNDDIQGTGGVVLSGFLNAAKLSSAASGRPLNDHKILFLGAGSAGVGVGRQLMSFFTLQGLTEAQAKANIYYMDSQGLITADRAGGLVEHKKYFARTDYTGPPLKNLVDVIAHVKPTALLGLSTMKNAFTQQVVEAMAGLNPRPIIFPLSNPVSLSECEFKDAVEWTDGNVIFASGSPFPVCNYKGKDYYPGQGNNMYIFPGLGLGAILSKAKHVTDSMVEAASLALAESLNEEEHSLGLIYPKLTRVRNVSAQIAHRVIHVAQEEGVDRNEHLRHLDDPHLLTYVEKKMWYPPH